MALFFILSEEITHKRPKKEKHLLLDESYEDAISNTISDENIVAGEISTD